MKKSIFSFFQRNSVSTESQIAEYIRRSGDILL